MKHMAMRHNVIKEIHQTPRRLCMALICGTLASGLMPMMAQDVDDDEPESSRKVEFVKVAKHKDVSEILRKDRPKESAAIPTPHFAIHTLDNKFVMTIGGQINPIIGADLGNDLYKRDGAGGAFVTNQIPVPPQAGHKSDFFINPLNAAVDLQVVGLGGTDNQITGYVKIGTNGLTNGIVLQRAYVTWRGFTGGQKLTLFQDELACQPPTIDPEGPSGCVSTVSYELSYTSKSYNGFRFALGLDMPSWYSSNGIYRGKDFKKWEGREIQGQPVCDPTAYSISAPDIPMWVEWGVSDTNRIRLSAIIRNFMYKDLLGDKRRTSVGWGLMLSGNLNPVKPLIFYLQAAYGRGIGAYIQDLAGQPLSYVPDDARPGYMRPSPMMGLNFGVTYNINPKWQVNAMVSGTRIWDVAPYAIAAGESDPAHLGNYKSALYAAGNVFYNISSYFQVGLEYLYGQRRTFGAGSASDNRLQMQFMFTL